MFYYTRATPNPAEERLALLANEVSCARLGMRGPAELAFIAQSIVGEIPQENRIAGLSRGRKIYVLRGLAPMNLVRTVAHESRHAWQRDHGTFNNSLRERDAKVYEYEFTLKLRGQTFDELCRELTALKPVPIRQTQPISHPIVSPMPSREFRGAPDKKSRLAYCENLLRRLSADASQWQRKNLIEEIIELKKEIA